MGRLTRRSNCGKYVYCEYDLKKCADKEKNGECDYCEHMPKMMNKLAYYEELEEKLQSVYGECDGLLEKVVDGLVKHEGVEFAKPMKTRLLTDVDVDKWDRLKGAMDRIVERLEDANMTAVDVANMRYDLYSDGVVEGIEKAIEIVKEEM